MAIPLTNEARIETSTACNAGCVFCPWPTDDFTRKKRIMPLSEYKFYVDKLKEEMGDVINEITISGFGEAFIDKTIVDKIRYAKSKGYGIHILTNGSLLNEQIIDEIYSIGILDLRISLHTTNPDSYNKILNFRSKKFTFENTLKNLDYAIKHKPKNTEVIITADIVDDNKEDVDKLIKDYGDKCSIDIWWPHNWVYGKEYRDVNQPKKLKTCGRPEKGPLQIQIDGDVIMCCFDFNNEMVLGNFKKQTLKEIFSLENNTPFSKVYNHHKQGTCGNSDLICKNCDQLLDKSDTLIYNNRTSHEERSKLTSTAFTNLEK